MAASQVRGPIRAFIEIATAVSVALIGLCRWVGTYQERIDEAKRPEDTVMVIVAARDLHQAVTITDEDLYAIQVPPRLLPEGVFLSPEHVVGRIPRERLLANEFVRADRLADPKSGVGLHAVIPRGMRAISVKIQDGAALSGFLNPGNHVDVMVPAENDKETFGFREKTLLKAVCVLGVNSRTQQDTEGASVTLLVTADDAERVAHAETVGGIRLSLRIDESLDKNCRLDEPGPLKRVSPKKACLELEVVQGGTKRTKRIDPVTGLDCQ